MAQYILKSDLVAEIERRKKYYENIQIIKPVYESNIEDFNELLSFLDTLEVKDVDLEKEIGNFFGDDDWKASAFEEEQRDMIKFARHFFELGLKARQ